MELILLLCAGETVKTLQKEGREKSLVVLDLCSGKGGDLLKWKKAGISRLVCAGGQWFSTHNTVDAEVCCCINLCFMICLIVDIAGTSVEQCEVRYREMMGRGHHDRYAGETFSAEFITADCTKVIRQVRDFHQVSRIQDI